EVVADRRVAPAPPREPGRPSAGVAPVVDDPDPLEPLHRGAPFRRGDAAPLEAGLEHPGRQVAVSERPRREVARLDAAALARERPGPRAAELEPGREAGGHDGL